MSEFETKPECGAAPPVRGVYDEQQGMSRPAGRSAQPSFVPGLCDPKAATDAFGHFAETGSIKLAPPKVSQHPLEDDQARMSHSVKEQRFNYAKESCHPDDGPEAHARQDALRVQGPPGNMSKAVPPPAPRLPRLDLAHCDVNVSCLPPEITAGESVKRGVGKVWSKIEETLGSPNAEVTPGPQGGAPRG